MHRNIVKEKKSSQTGIDPEMALWFSNSSYKYNKGIYAHNESTGGGNLSWRVKVMKKEPNENSRSEKA